MRRHIKTFLGYLLTITLIFSDLSIVAYAEESAGTTEDQIVTTDTETADVTSETEDTLAEPEIISELTDKRDEKTKYFAMSDGTIKACIYPQNVHYLEDGKYEEIDNTLVETTENDKTYYKNKENGFSVKMPQVFTDDYIEFSDENGYVKFKLQGATNKKIEKIEKEQAKKNTDITTVNNVNDKAIFKSIKGDIDIEYDLAGNKLKETIVLYKKTKNSFVFDVQTSAESAEVNTDNSISFYDVEGVERYMIASPYMTDSAGEYSNSVQTKLIKNENGYTLTYTPDYEWLSAKEREYPVKIDPTLFQAIYKETVTDTYISNVQTSSNPDIRGYWDVLNIGRRKTTLSNGSQLIKRGLIRFDIPSEIGKIDCIVDAKLDLVHYTVSNAVSVNGIQIDVHELTSDFTEGGTWWGNQPSYDSIITDYVIVNTSNTFSGSTLSYDSYNITRLVNKWHNGSTNYGIMLKLHDEGTTVSSSKQVYYFAKQSTYYGSVSKFVEITYRNCVGLEDYWSYVTYNSGDRGSTYINNFNGNLTYIHNDVTFNSNINGFTIAHVYNSAESTTISNYENTLIRHGNGWRLNLGQRLFPMTVSGNSSVKYMYYDQDRTKHYFVQTEDGTIVDEDGLGYTLTEIDEYVDSNTTPLKQEIKTKDNLSLKFDVCGYLRRITDSNGNWIALHYTSAEVDNYLSMIETSSGGSFTLSYDSNRYLTTITDNANRIITYQYNNGFLEHIYYPDGTATHFTYDIGGSNAMTAIQYSGNKHNHYSYDQNKRVKSVQTNGSNDEAGAVYSYEYDYNQTKIIDSRNRSVTYQFDTFGRPTCAYDSQGNAISQSYTSTNVTTSEIFNNNKVSVSANSSHYINNLLNNGSFGKGLTDWTTYSDIATATSEVVSNATLLSQQSIKLSLNTVGTSKIIQQLSGLSGGDTYTATAYIKLENVQSESKGVAIEVRTSNSRYLYSEYATGTTDTNIDNGFSKLTFTFTLASGETVNKIAVGLYSSTGIMYIDCVQLEEGNTSNSINLLSNSSFEQNGAGDTAPNYFNSCVNGYVSNAYSKDGSKSFHIGGVSNNKIISGQTIYFNGKIGDSYNYGAWGKANAIPSHEEGEGCFKIIVQVLNVDGTVQRSVAEFNEYVSDWQFTSAIVIAEKPHYGINVYMGYYNACNAAYFDNLYLYRDTAQSYTYDSKGNIISTADNANQQANYEYNNSNLSKILNPTGTSYEYAYDTNNNMVNSKSSEGLQSNITYDSQGNPISAVTSVNNYSATLQSGKTYYIRLKNTGKYLCVPNSSTQNFTNLQQEYFTGASNQRWILEAAPKGGFYLHPEHAPEMSLHITNSENYENASVAVYSHIATPQQTFQIILQSDHAYKLIPNTSPDGKVVSVEYSYEKNLVTIMTPQGINNAGQSWYFEEASIPVITEIEDGAIYQFRARNSGKYIDVTDASTSIGTNITQNLLDYDDNQQFILEKYGSTEYYTLTPLHDTTKLVQISTDIGMDGNLHLQLGDTTVNERKLFKFEFDTQYQGFYIIPKCDTTLALSVANNSIANEANLIFAEKSLAINRFFITEKISDTIISSATYQDNGNYISTTTDARGNTTTYTYDTSRGLQTGVTDAKDNTTSYTYNALNDRLESVSLGNSTVSYQYETNGALKNITTANGMIYNFLYDVFGRTSKISVGSQVLSETIYRDDFSSLVEKFKYGNGVYKTYTYDNQDRLISESINGTEIRTYVYDKSGNIAKITDLITNVTTTFRYDLIGRTVEMKTSDGQSVNFVYDKFNRLSLSKWSIGNTLLSSGYIYGDNSVDGQKTGLIYGVNLNDTQQLAYQYDELARLKTRTLNTTTPFVAEYGYLEGATANTTTTLVKKVKNGNDTLEYTYDELGNITSVAKNGTIIEEYSYDSLEQLTSATYGGNTYTYSYDNGGNITEIKKNDVVIKSYTYGNSEWTDLLTAFNGETITYDEIGNPLTYRNSMNFSWQNGRQLATVSQNGNAVATYAYNADGLRTTKTVNGTTTEYYWQNGTLYGQKTGDEYIFFLYDENGSVYGFIIQNGEEKSYYYYEFNLQGDIIGIIDSTGTKVVEYTYGAWGDILSVTGTLADTIGQKNPLRYRGYYYDAETGFTYL